MNELTEYLRDQIIINNYWLFRSALPILESRCQQNNADYRYHLDSLLLFAAMTGRHNFLPPLLACGACAERKFNIYKKDRLIIDSWVEVMAQEYFEQAPTSKAHPSQRDYRLVEDTSSDDETAAEQFVISINNVSEDEKSLFESLPRETLEHIVKFLPSQRDVKNFALTCQSFYNAARHADKTSVLLRSLNERQSSFATCFFNKKNSRAKKDTLKKLNLWKSITCTPHPLVLKRIRECSEFLINKQRQMSFMQLYYSWTHYNNHESLDLQQIVSVSFVAQMSSFYLVCFFIGVLAGYAIYAMNSENQYELGTVLGIAFAFSSVLLVPVLLGVCLATKFFNYQGSMMISALQPDERALIETIPDYPFVEYGVKQSASSDVENQAETYHEVNEDLTFFAFAKEILEPKEIKSVPENFGLYNRDDLFYNSQQSDMAAASSSASPSLRLSCS